MPHKPFDNLPKLSKQDALLILNTPFCYIKSKSDYYKAVFHLSNYPCSETEKALISLLEVENNELEFKIAQRKAVEVLGQIGCKGAIPILGGCLKSSDPYLVETTAWALGKLGCQDIKLHSLMLSMLDDPKQNRRVIIQSLASLGVVKLLPKIDFLLKNDYSSVELRGAAIAAKFRLNGDCDCISELKDFLISTNQNDRYCAVQDIIDSRNCEMLPFIISSPVSPFFKIRAIEAFWNEGLLEFGNSYLFDKLESIILDEPENINLKNEYNFKPDIDFLISELFSTDFSNCYRAMRALKEFPDNQIAEGLSKEWHRAKKDYGALYFFVSLYRSFISKGIREYNIQENIEYLLSNQWSDFIKFRPLSIICLMHYDKMNFVKRCYKLLDEKSTPYWLNRYTALFCLSNFDKDTEILTLIKGSFEDSHTFVKTKALQLYKRFT